MLTLLLALACTKTPPAPVKSDTAIDANDLDGDGFRVEEGDCDDADPDVAPGAQETCDGVDQDCDGAVDEDVVHTYYADADGDGFGDASQPSVACERPEGTATTATDCDDDDERVYPGADDPCDGVDQDCDGDVDDGRARTVYADADGDGHGDVATGRSTCGDDVGWVSSSDDCDDRTADAFPGHPEVCDEVDNDCDGTVDEGVAGTFWEDRDGDGYGDTDHAQEACVRPTGYSALAGDCDDTDRAYNPGAAEVCTDPRDLNCDGSTGYADTDGDGFAACVECDDLDSTVFPGGTETCNGRDDDCDGLVDDDDATMDAASATDWFVDADGDGFGTGTPIRACVAPAGTVATFGDCDDADPAVSPAGLEVCNALDDDCDGLVDDADASLDLADATDWYVDLDGDGYGGTGDTIRACDAPVGHVASPADCDDTDATVSPEGFEVCGGADEDCDGLVDDADPDLDLGTATRWYADADGDGHGAVTTGTLACEAPAGTAASGDDCDDADGDVHPGALELWDCADQDCDGGALPTGDGRDGTVTAGSTFSTTSTTLVGGASTGAAGLSVTSSAGFASGDLVLVMTAFGATAGTWEVAHVTATSAGRLDLATPLTHAYAASDTTGVQRIPQYRTLTVPAGTTMTAPSWSGSGSAGGGVLAFVAQDLQLAGTLSASARGYRGGARTSSRTQTGEQGESWMGATSRSTSANRSGGGGGYSPSLTHACGGGGAYRTAGGTGGAPGGWGNVPGSGGSASGSADLTWLFMGGGGGSGSLDSDADGGSYGGQGGSGGGIVLVSAGSMAFTGSVVANGGNGENGYYSGSAASPGGGGAGAGGSVWLGARTLTASSGTVRAGGGTGGTGSEAGSSATTGGAGGDGAIRLTLPSMVSASPAVYATCP